MKKLSHAGNWITFDEGSGTKKYKATVRSKATGRIIKTTQFGHREYQQFKDLVPLKLYSHLDHKDKARRSNYLKRSRGIRDARGRMTSTVPYTSNWFSINYLW